MRDRAIIVLIAVLVGAVAVTASAQPGQPPVEAAAAAVAEEAAPEACQPVTTERFALYSDPWINLHHFLYQWARAGVEPGPGDTRHPVEVTERDELASLTDEERAAWQGVVDRYAADYVTRSLTFDRELVGLKARLAEIGCGAGPEAAAGLPAPFDELLAAAMPIYRRHWWPRHDAANREWIAELAGRLPQVEAAVTPRLAEAYGGSWPEGPMRVDAGAYANHTAAYTTDRPDHVMLGVTPPLHQGWGAVEALLHEAGHSLGLEQGVHASLEAAFTAAGAGEPPRGLWHVLLFVTPHELLRQRLAVLGIEAGPSYADEAGIYGRNEVWAGYRDALAAEWVPYLRGERGRDEALAALVRRLAPPEPAAAAAAVPSADGAGDVECRFFRSGWFAFHSDPWSNLHHFLFEWARAGKEPAPGDLRAPIEVPERAELGALDDGEREAWDRAAAHYAGHLVDRHLLFDQDLIRLKSQIHGLCNGGEEALAALPEPLGELLAAAMPIYRRHWWPRHDAANRAWIDLAGDKLSNVEPRLSQRLAEAYGGRWPEPAPAGQVRVDVGVYAGDTAAYTTTFPDNVTLSSTHPLHQGWLSMEVLFHEASHTNGLGQGVLGTLGRAFAAHGAEPPRNLWHVMMFVTPHELLRQLLAESDVDLGPSYAERAAIYDRLPAWARYHEVLAEEWVPYLRGEREREEALAAVVDRLSPPTEEASASSP